MNELLKLNYDNERITLSARELHNALDIQTRFNDWFPRMCDYGFNEEKDYIAITQKRVTAQGNETTYKDYQITIDMAKEIAMLQRNEKGKEVRKYFIEVEKEWNSPERVMARALRIAENELNSIKAEVKRLKPKALFADVVETSDTSILIGDMAKLLKQNRIDIGQKRLFEWLRNHDYLIKKGNSKNMPTQKAMDLGLFEVKERTITNPDGSVRVTRTTKVTGKGQIYFVNKFLKTK